MAITLFNTDPQISAPWIVSPFGGGVLIERPTCARVRLQREAEALGDKLEKATGEIERLRAENKILTDEVAVARAEAAVRTLCGVLVRMGRDKYP